VPQVLGWRELAEYSWTGTIRKNVTATAAGNTTVWTPAAGKKFHLLGYYIEVNGHITTAAGGLLTIDLNDSGTSLNQTHSVFVPATGAVSTTNNPTLLTHVDFPLGYGYLSAAANNLLQINLSAVLTNGQVQIKAVGIEE